MVTTMVIGFTADAQLQVCWRGSHWSAGAAVETGGRNVLVADSPRVGWVVGRVGWLATMNGYEYRGT